MRKAKARGADFVGGQSVEHERVIGVGAVRDGDLAERIRILSGRHVGGFRNCSHLGSTHESYSTLFIQRRPRTANAADNNYFYSSLLSILIPLSSSCVVSDPRLPLQASL